MGISSYAVPSGLGAVAAPADVALQSGVGAVGASALLARADHSHRLLDTGWLTPTLLNGWVVYDATYGNAAMYRKIGNIVFCRGLVKNGSPATATIFTLPAGFRPGIIHLFATESLDTIARVQVEPNGNVNPGAGAGAGWFALNNIVFPADA